MAPFPRDSIKAETLHSICKDLGKNSGTKRKREDMITILKEVETPRGLSSASQDIEPVNKKTRPNPVTELPNDDQHDIMDAGVRPKSDGEPICRCADGWLSPRMKFILSIVAEVASDIVRDTGEFAVEQGDVYGVYMTDHIPQEELPRGKKAAALWVRGLSTIYKMIYIMFKLGHIPTESVLLEALETHQQPHKILVGAYTKYTEIGHALSALVLQAKEDWADGFQETHCDGKKEWNELPVCAEHDLNWAVAEDMLVG